VGCAEAHGSFVAVGTGVGSGLRVAKAVGPIGTVTSGLAVGRPLKVALGRTAAVAGGDEADAVGDPREDAVHAERHVVARSIAIAMLGARPAPFPSIRSTAPTSLPLLS
jgi:hypothetical protein